MVKRYLILGVGAALLLALAGCGRADTDSTPPTTTAPATTVTLALPTTAPTAAYPPVGYVNASSLHVRPEPNTDKYAIGGLKFGDMVTIVGKEGDWYKIQFKDGFGYVNAQYILDTMPVSGAQTTETTEAAEATETTEATDTPADTDQTTE